MASKSALSLLLIIFSSFLHLGFSNPNLSQLPPSLIQEQGPGGNMQCMQKLLPCQPYLKSPASGTPPAACCQPLKDMVTKDTDCLCDIFNNPQMLQSMNITKDDALKVPKACGADADVSKCKKDANSSSGSPTSSPSSGSQPAPADKGSNSTSSTNAITPYEATHFGVCGIAALMVVLGFSAY